MAERIRKSQEEEIIEVLEREGFEELNKMDLQKEPYKSIYSLPDCFSEENNQKLKTRKNT
jgi:hypothetical protein